MDFELFEADCTFTDDTVPAVAVADCMLNGHHYVDAFHEYVRAYPNAGYGFNFFRWASSGDRNPYNSWGNGAAMRMSAIGHAFDRLEDVLAEAARSAEVTHNHPEGVKGAQATAAAAFLARPRRSKGEIRCVLPGHRAAGTHCISRINQLRRRHPQGRFVGRRCRHAGVYHWGSCGSILWRPPNRYRGTKVGGLGCSPTKRCR